MKKVILILAVAAFTSCSKKDETCNCGYITADEITYDANSNPCYSLTIRNSCSKNEKTFCFDQSVWYDGNIGEDFCVYNVESW